MRNIVKVGDETLRKISKPVKNFDEGLWTLLDDMKETMRKNNGMGLAAPQVGVLKRVIVVEVNGNYFELINPEIVASSGKDYDEEACLSVTGVQEKVWRPMKVTVKAQDRYGYDVKISGEKYLARCFCHEIDHLNGILFIDYLKDNK